jgi:PAS domain S-box-containing protein
MAMLGAPNKRGMWRFLVPLWIAGCLLLGAIAAVCFWLQLSIATVGFCMLIAIVMLSLLDSFVSSALFSVVGTLLLSYFFTPPVYSFQIEKIADVVPLVAFLVSSIAVTALVRRLRDAEHAQREHARLLDLTHDTVFVRDNRGVITYWNRAAEVLYGWSREEAVGKRVDDLLQTVFPFAREEVEHMLLRDGHWEGELRHAKRNGEAVFVSSRWTLQRDDSGRPIGKLESNNDITERKQTQELLQRSQAQYLAEAQRLSKTGSFGWNVKTGEVFWSAQAFEIFEYDPAQTPTLDMVRQRIHPDDVPIFDRMLSQVSSGQLTDFDVELRLRMPDGRIKYLHIVARVGPNGSIDSRQFIGAAMDITAARRTEERLRQALTELARATRITALGELSASIAHEVGQPLAAIVTNAEACEIWLKRQPLDLDEVSRCVAQIVEEGTRAADIVQRIRRLMKGAPPEHVPLDVNEVIDEAVGLVRRDVERQGCSLRVALAADLPRVAADRVQLQQVLVNLVLNGVQAMATRDAQRELAIESRREANGEVAVTVQDSGPGIRDEDLPRLFEPFFTTRSAGMGMGLAICTSILESHGGRIEASNNAGHRGATFRFVLPAMPEAMPPG